MDQLFDTLLVTSQHNNEMEHLLAEVNSLLEQSDDLEQNEKERLGELFCQIVKWNNDGNEFEEYYLKFSQMMKSMKELDFSKRLPTYGFQKSFLNFIALGLNTINEDLENEVVSRASFDHVKNISVFGIFVTDTNYCIKQVNQKFLDKLGFLEEDLINKSAETLFPYFDEIETSIEEGSASEGMFGKVLNKGYKVVDCKLAVERATMKDNESVGFTFIIYEFGNKLSFIDCGVPSLSYKRRKDNE